MEGGGKNIGGRNSESDITSTPGTQWGRGLTFNGIFHFNMDFGIDNVSFRIKC